MICVILPKGIIFCIITNFTIHIYNHSSNIHIYNHPSQKKPCRNTAKKTKIKVWNFGVWGIIEQIFARIFTVAFRIADPTRGFLPPKCPDYPKYDIWYKTKTKTPFLLIFGPRKRYLVFIVFYWNITILGVGYTKVKKINGVVPQGTVFFLWLIS